MSAQVPEIECRLCSTLFPETSRFCPNCREPRPDIHEDLLMAARLTGVAYEVLLQRAWIEAGVAVSRRPPPAAEAPPAPVERPGWVQREVVERVQSQRDAAAVGCVALLAIIILAVTVAVLVLLVRDDDDDAPEEGANAPVVTSTATAGPATTPTATSPSGGAPGAGGGQGTAVDDPTPTAARPLVLPAGQPAGYADGYQARVLSFDDQVDADSSGRSPGFGFNFVAIEVEVCGGEEPVDAGPTDWMLEMPDGERFQRTDIVVDPALEAVTLASGDCASGWMTFEVPIDPDPAYIIHANPAYEAARFAWPG